MTSTNTVDIHHNPYPPGQLPPPWYRPPAHVTKGPTRTFSCIIGGLLIDNAEGRRWFKDTYGRELAAHGRQDMNVYLRLRKLFPEKGIDAFTCVLAPRRMESAIEDFLVITHVETGSFENDGPLAYEEVLQEERRPIPGVKEERVKAQLKEAFGIETCGYKSYYSDKYY